MSQAFTLQLDLKTQKTNILAQKIDDTTLKTYEMVVSIFSLLDKDGKEWFFEESFLLTKVKLDVIFRIFFLIMSNANINFQAWDL